MSDSVRAVQDVVSRPAREACFDLAEGAFDLLVIVSLPDMWLRYMSPPGRHLLKVGPDEDITDQPWPDFVNSDGLMAMLYEAAPSAIAGDTWRGAATLRARDGTTIPARLFVAGFQADDGGCHAIVAGVDDSSTRDTEHTLLHEQLLLRSLLDFVPDAIYFKDVESRFLRGSSALARKIGLRSAQELVGKTDFDIFDREHAQAAFEDEQQIIFGGTPIIDVEEKEVLPGREIRWISTTKLPLRDSRGKIIGTFGISHDITGRKRAEEERRTHAEQLHLAQKMESIGRLAAGVAHEINTPTQYINDNAHFLVGAFEQLSQVIAAYRGLRTCAVRHEDCLQAVEGCEVAEAQAECDYLIPEILRTLEQSIDGISRIARIVRSLKEYSHPNSPERKPASLNHAVEIAVTVSRHEWKYVADMKTRLDPALPPVPCVLDEFNQVLLNLIVNASHAIGEATAGRPDARGLITIETRLDGDWAVVEVSDTGTGIPPEIQSRVFEPFFTTKSVDKGTGQGLALVRTVIENHHHGTVGFTTEAGRGTTFQLRLPVGAATPVDEASLSEKLPSVP